MWTEITINQAKDFAINKTDATLYKMCSIQAEMTDYYAQISNPDSLAILLINKAEKYQARAFYYEDENFEMNLVLKLDPEGKLRVLTAALGKYTDITKSAPILLKKLFEAMDDYKVDYCYCLIPTERKTKGALFMEQFLIKKYFVNVGFKDIRFGEIENGQRIKLEAFK